MDWKPMKKNLILLTYGLVLFFALYHIQDFKNIFLFILGILGPFLMGGGLAFILNIPMSFLERRLLAGMDARPGLRKLRRPLSMILTLILFVLILLLVTFMVVPQLGDTLQKIINQVPGAIARFDVWIREQNIDWVVVQDVIPETWTDTKALTEKLMGVAQGWLPSFFGSAFSVVSTAVSAVFNFTVGFIFAIYILSSKEKLCVQCQKFLYALLPQRRAAQAVYFFRLVNKTFRSFFTGQCLEAIILGLMFLVSMSILRLPYALLTSVVIMVTALIPIFGAFIGCVLGAFFILMVNPLQALEFLILFFVLQQIEGNIIYPHVVGGSVGLPSIWVLVSVTVGGSLLGVVGMIVFIPIVSVCYVLLRDWMYSSLKKKEAQDAGGESGGQGRE